MKKFTIIYRKGVTVLQEVELELIQPLEDPSLLWSLKPAEYKARVLKPNSLYEKQSDGKLTAPVWYSHAFYSSEEEARTHAEQDITAEFQRTAQKSNTEFDVVACLARCKEIQVIIL